MVSRYVSLVAYSCSDALVVLTNVNRRSCNVWDIEREVLQHLCGAWCSIAGPSDA